ncbi:hypothetical protein [Streptomyces sp. NPDC050355]|uniref:hypothetical protein n=1 Tax=Streptomyces sp. NPDC050355 TaxID=3365609 RepID=UPI0037960778
MGDYFQTIVDVDATAEDAARLGAKVVAWLVAEGIVEAEPSNCVLDGDGRGHAAGPRYGTAVHDDTYENGGLYVHVGRTMFDSGQGHPEAVTCPHCSARTELTLADQPWEPDDEAWEPFRGAIRGWDEGDAEATKVGCRSCGRAAPVDRWRWKDDFFAFGHLGFTFWNWTNLRDAFVAEFSPRLGGHRTVELGGKL